MTRMSFFAALLAGALAVPAFGAGGPEPIVLPKPETGGGKPLMQALGERRSGRNFGSRKLPLQVLSNLLWAADGINRPATGGRTAPSAGNWQDTDIYVALAEGLYVYNYKAHRLDPVLPGDLRAVTGTQSFVANAALNLVYVADYSRMRAREEDRLLYAGVHTGLISQNVSLFCASEGLISVVRGLVDRAALAKAMKLRPDQRITFAQSVGYPSN